MDGVSEVWVMVAAVAIVFIGMVYVGVTACWIIHCLEKWYEAPRRSNDAQAAALIAFAAPLWPLMLVVDAVRFFIDMFGLGRSEKEEP